MNYGISVTELEVLAGEKKRLQKISFELSPGEHAVVTGASGSGKTTLLRVLSGLHTDYRGNVEYQIANRVADQRADQGAESGTSDGRNTGINGGTHSSAEMMHQHGDSLSPAELLRQHGISVLFQENRLLPELSAIENIRITLPKKANETIAEARKKLRDELANLLPGVDLEKTVRKLSGGEQRRVALARALLQDARVLLLDEPFTGLDEKAASLALDFINKKSAGKTMLVTDHEGVHFPEWKRIHVGEATDSAQHNK